MPGLRNQTLIVQRKATGHYKKGYYVEDTPDTNFTISSNVQPLTGTEIKLLPENRRDVENIKLYADTKLRSQENGQNINPDIVFYNDARYEVINVKQWRNGIINHYEIICSKITSNDRNVS